MNAPGTMPRWPKGPFPERYRFPVVEARLATAWSTREEAFAELVQGLEPLGPEDPWLRLRRAPDDTTPRDALRQQAAEAAITAFTWIAPARTRGQDSDAPSVVGFVPTADLVDAVTAVGVAGPLHGIGMPAIVRFLVTLRTFAAFEIAAMGEDCLELALRPKSDDALTRISERVLRICPSLARRADAASVAASIRESARLRLEWA